MPIGVNQPYDFKLLCFLSSVLTGKANLQRVPRDGGFFRVA